LDARDIRFHCNCGMPDQLRFIFANTLSKSPDPFS